MITLPEKITIDMRNLSHAKDLEDLWEDETEAFIFGLYTPRVHTYINNINLKKKNSLLYYEMLTILEDCRKYKDKIEELIKNYIDDGSAIGLVNHVLNNIEFEDKIDLHKVAYMMGNYIRFNLVR